MSDPGQTPGITTAAAPSPPQTPKRGRPSGRRKWLYRLVAMTLVPAIVFGTIECGLRIGGYGRDTSFFLDGSKLERPGVWIDNREFGRWAFPRGLDQIPSPIPFVLNAEKKPGTYRVFILGESAAMGFPEPSFNFGRILETMLRARYPDTRFEVVNAAMVAINSHIVLPIARECADHEPDLFIVHLGNNEVVGPYGAAGVLGRSVPSRRAIRTNLSIRRTRTGQLFASLIAGLKGGDDGQRKWDGMAMFADSHVRIDDPRLSRTYDCFRENLRDVCRAGSDVGVPVVVCTIPVNLKDSAPFGSQHATNLSAEQTTLWNALYAEGVRLESERNYTEALACFRNASQLDDQFADLEFRQARCLAALGKHAEAREKYARARDLDTLRFRSDTTINRIVRDVAAERANEGIHLADAEGTFEAASPMQVPGEELFLEHVHMNFAGNYLMARTVLQTIVPILDGRLPGERRPEPLTQQQCADRLAFTPWNELRIISHIRHAMLHETPFTGQLDKEERNCRWESKERACRSQLVPDAIQAALRVHSAALGEARDDWMIRINYSELLAETGNLGLAKDELMTVLRTFRHSFKGHCNLGQILLETGKIALAEDHFREAIRLIPEWGEAHVGLARSLGAQGKVDEGLAIFETHLAKALDRGNILVEMGIYLFKANRLEDAKVRLLEAVQLKPHEARAQATLGDIFLKQGMPKDALVHYESALRIVPDWPELKKDVTKLKGELNGLTKK